MGFKLASRAQKREKDSIDGEGAHQHMDERVEHTAEPSLSSRPELHDGPPDGEECCGVVVHVKEAYLSVVLAPQRTTIVRKMASMRVRWVGNGDSAMLRLGMIHTRYQKFIDSKLSSWKITGGTMQCRYQ
jgi:hypothetical protein